ncbi:uncharacterized protein LOC126665253 [Mercurialis annua]|uniref:uncharacterized protein LOC126665253 n=1 Tax=Mercurialis annua TaxID=3986 RepID=UPI00215E2129|nr:uncharacterized protein LOC126665253 [Mercurialis annua]
MPEDFRLAKGRNALPNRIKDEQEELKKDFAKETVVVEQRAKEEERENLIANLPLDILTLVWERLFLFDYICFRRVCKNFRSMTPPLHWTTNGIESLHRTILFSKDGWLLMSNGANGVFCFNPFKKIIHRLPDITQNGFLLSMGFSHPPTSSKCSFIGIADRMEQGHPIYHFRMEEKNWNHYRIVIDKDFIPGNNPPVFQDDFFYFLDKRGRLATCRIKEDRCLWEVLTEPHSPYLNSENNYLLECDNEIFSVFVGRSGRNVLVF